MLEIKKIICLNILMMHTFEQVFYIDMETNGIVDMMYVCI